MSELPRRPGRARIARQGALLFSGYAVSQALSFARNAIVAHWLSKGDFGIAAAIVLLLQLLETLSDLGADRLIVQARDGDEPRLVATAHATLVLRGLLTALALFAIAAPMAHFFGIPEAQWAFAAAALVPLVKGFVSLDSRLAQRHLDNRPQMLIEALPQLAGVVLVIPAIRIFGDYSAVLWLSLAQALVAVIISHAIAARPYRLALDRAYLKRLVVFGWPIWASAFPLIAVYQGDRMLIGHLIGMEGLAAYTAAFMITMVPGLIAAKVANALMLPLLSSERDDMRAFAARFRMMAEATSLASALYLIAFIIAGGAVLPLAFGSNYTGLGALVGWLALMWSLRMLQAVPGAALLAKGITKPFFTAGMIRACGLILAFVAVKWGHGLEGAAAAGALAEFFSLAYVTWRLDRLQDRTAPADATELNHRLGTSMALRGLLLLPAGLIALTVTAVTPQAATYLTLALLLTAVSLAVIALAALTMPDSKRELRALRSSKRQGAAHASASIGSAIKGALRSGQHG